MSYTKIKKNLVCIKQGQDMCLYACVEMLLNYNGIKDYNQYKLFKLYNGGVVYEMVKLLKKQNIPGIIIDYPEHNECTIEKIKENIRHDCPVLVNLYSKHHSDQGVGHSFIIYAFSEGDKEIYLIDPNKDCKNRKVFLSYVEFQKQWENGPKLESIAIRQACI